MCDVWALNLSQILSFVTGCDADDIREGIQALFTGHINGFIKIKSQQQQQWRKTMYKIL